MSICFVTVALAFCRTAVTCEFSEGFEGFVRRVIGCFNAVGLDYKFTGALAASYYGTPRISADIDVSFTEAMS